MTDAVIIRDGKVIPVYLESELGARSASSAWQAAAEAQSSENDAETAAAAAQAAAAVSGSNASAAGTSADTAAAQALLASTSLAAIASAIAGLPMGALPVMLATRTLMKAQAAPAIGNACLLLEAGREGLFVVEAYAGHAAAVAADTAEGMFVRSSYDPSKVYVRKPDGEVNVRWFGAVGDDSTNDLPAFLAALAALRAASPVTSGSTRPTARLFVPAGTYYMSAALNIHQPVHIIGDGSGSVVLRFAPNCNGVIFNEWRTDGMTGVASDNGLGDSGYSIIEGIDAWGGGAASRSGPYTNPASTVGHGFVVRSNPVTIRDCFAAFFAEDGYHVVTTSGDLSGGGVNQGNANNFLLQSCRALYNGRHGFCVAGSDANAGAVTLCSAISNGGSGFLDYSFLGNSYDTCHSRDNGYQDPTGLGIYGVCTYAGSRYAVAAQQEAAASTTVPGTNSAVWIPIGGVGGRAWVSGLAWVIGAPYATNPGNVNARNLFKACYAEDNQGPVQATTPSMFVAPNIDGVGLVGNATWLRGSAVGLDSPHGFRVSNGGTTELQIGQNGGNDVYFHQLGSDNYSVAKDGTVIRTLHQHANTSATMGLASDAGNYGPFHHFFEALFVGGTGNWTNGVRIGTVQSIAGLNGMVLRAGDLFTNRWAGPGEPLAWICTTAGTFGSGATVEAIGGDARPHITQSGTSYTAALTDAGRFVRFTSGSAVTFTIPTNASVAFPLGTEISIVQAGAGIVTIAAAGGVTLNAFGGVLTTAGQFAAATLKKVGTNTWDVMGKLA